METAESRICFGLQFGAIDADGVAAFLTSLISNLAGVLAFMVDNPSKQV